MKEVTAIAAICLIAIIVVAFLPKHEQSLCFGHVFVVAGSCD